MHLHWSAKTSFENSTRLLRDLEGVKNTTPKDSRDIFIYLKRCYASFAKRQRLHSCHYQNTGVKTHRISFLSCRESQSSSKQCLIVYLNFSLTVKPRTRIQMIFRISSLQKFLHREWGAIQNFWSPKQDRRGLRISDPLQKHERGFRIPDPPKITCRWGRIQKLWSPKSAQERTLNFLSPR